MADTVVFEQKTSNPAALLRMAADYIEEHNLTPLALSFHIFTDGDYYLEYLTLSAE